MPKRETKQSKKKIIINTVIGVIILALSYFFDTQYHIISQLFENPSTNGKNDLQIHFVDVGQGDCIIIRLPDGKNMVIDGGPKSACDEVLNYISTKLNISVFDYLLLTHTDSDHTGSLDDIILNTQIKNGEPLNSLY